MSTESGTENGIVLDPSHKPATVSMVISLILGLLVVGLTVIAVPVLTFPIAGFGVIVVALGLALGRRKVLDLGALVLLIAAIISGLGGLHLELLLLTMLLLILVWDIGENAISVGEQLTREASTIRGELGHASVMIAVGIVPVVIGYAAFETGTGGQPISVVLFSVIAVSLIAWALRR